MSNPKIEFVLELTKDEAVALYQELADTIHHTGGFMPDSNLEAILWAMDELNVREFRCPSCNKEGIL